MSIKLADVQHEYEKDKKLRKEDIKSLQEWAEKQPHLPPISELQLILFLQSCYYSQELAKTTTDTFFTVKTMCPELFANRDPTTSKFQNDAKIVAYVPLPKLTPEKYRVIYCKLVDSDTNKYNYAEQLKIFDMSLMLWMMQEGTAEGLIMIIDMEMIVFGHLTKITISTMKRFLYYLQEAMPVRLKGLHFINIVSFMDKVLAIMKPFMKKELIDMLHLHTDSLDKLYKSVPKDSLPNHLGGTAGDLSQLHEARNKTITENAEYFKKEEKQIADESKRIGKPKNASDIFGVEGSFKKLDID